MNPSLSGRPNQWVERNDAICYLFPFKIGAGVKCGADPLVRAGPPGPACCSLTEQADVGVGCGPGGPPH